MAAEVRVLVVTPDFPPARGGIQTLVHRVVHFAESIEVLVVTPDHPEAAAFDSEQGCEIIRVAGPDGVRRIRTAMLNGRALAEGRRFRPDVVLSAHIVVSPATATLRRLLRVPVVQYVYAKEIGAKPALARFALRNADRIITISQYAAALATQVGGDRERMVMISPGVDLPKMNRRAPAAEPTLLTIARLEDRYKGHDVLLRALPLIRASVPDVRWIVVGDGPLRPSLERMAETLFVRDHVHFLGAVSDAERDSWLWRAHVLAMPSRLPAGGFAGEGFGIVYLEANAHGMPVVAGNVAGALDAVEHQRTGLLVDPTDHLAVADAVVTLLRDSELATRLGEHGRDRAQGFSWPKIARRVERVLQETAAT
jgi:phosphatidylinositol alpha-1,6-mannosyltransferase